MSPSLRPDKLKQDYKKNFRTYLDSEGPALEAEQPQGSVSRERVTEQPAGMVVEGEPWTGQVEELKTRGLS